MKKMWKITYKVDLLFQTSGSMSVAYQKGGTEIFTEDATDAAKVVIEQVKKTPEALRVYDIEATTTSIG
jgi:hypothetical protein